jgi:hypothetical protein
MWKNRVFNEFYIEKANVYFDSIGGEVSKSLFWLPRD